MSISLTASNLNDLDGLQAAKRMVDSLRNRQELVHAVLIFGEEGSGKTTVARTIAKEWLCRGNDPEHTCTACAAFDRGLSSDFLAVSPEGPSRIIRLAQIVDSGRSDDETLALQRFLRTPPLSSPRKVVLIEEADRLNSDASNALLKILEEPPPYAKIVLTTHALSRVLPTIRSRCVGIVCEMPFPTTLGGFEIATSGGSPGTKQLVDANLQIFQNLFDFAESLPGISRTKALVVSEKLRKLCDDFEKKLDLGAREAQALTLKHLAQIELSLHPDRPHIALEIAEAHRRIVGNGNATLIFDALVAKLLA